MFRRHVLGQKPDSSPGSNTRRLLSRLSLIIVLTLVAESALAPRGVIEAGLTRLVGFVLVVWSVLYFALMVLYVLFRASAAFRPAPLRLFGDTLISIALAVLSFALLYRSYGIIGPDNVTAILSRDYLYFSAVTFSTLGFGDFRPVPEARLIAASQAILGNLHLGIIVGAAFFAAQNHSGSENSTDDKREDQHSKSD